MSPEVKLAHQAELQEIPVKEIGESRLDVEGEELALFSSAPLGSVNPAAQSAFIVIHGAIRNAGDHFRAIRAVVGHAEDKVVVAPQFLTDVDVRGELELSRLLHWSTEDWKGGLGRVSSFTVLDRLLESLRTDLPRLQGVTIVGNSAGGQFVNRYAAVGRGPHLVDVPIRFIVSNPSTYLYFDCLRQDLGGGFSAHEDPSVSHWRYGFDGLLPDYVDREPGEYFHDYVRRDVTYLLGERDSDPGAALLEIHPAAMAQGRDRRERGERYHAYLQHKAGCEVHRLITVAGIGHDGPAVYGSAEGSSCLLGGLPGGPEAHPVGSASGSAHEGFS